MRPQITIDLASLSSFCESLSFSFGVANAGALGDTARVTFALRFPEEFPEAKETLRITVLYSDWAIDKWLSYRPGETVRETLDIAVDHGSEKVLFGIDASSGRALLLGDLYVRPEYADFYAIPMKELCRAGEPLRHLISTITSLVSRP